MLMEGQVKFRSPQNIAAFSLTTEVDGDSFQNRKGLYTAGLV